VHWFAFVLLLCSRRLEMVEHALVRFCICYSDVADVVAGKLKCNKTRISIVNAGTLIRLFAREPSK